MTRHVAYLGLGSNLGDREDNISRAIVLIGELAGDVVRQSALFYSEPWGFESENAFINAVVCIHTHLTPHRLLRVTQRIERQLGKTKAHATERRQGQAQKAALSEAGKNGCAPVYHDRPIDIDILLYDDVTLHTPTLTIPHPHIHERPFVAIPLQEVFAE